MKQIKLFTLACAVSLSVGCTVSSEAGIGSEAATSIVSGSLNLPASTTLGLNAPVPTPRLRPLDVLWKAINPVGRALAATWTCSGGTLAPSYDGPGMDPYAYTPVSCSVTWLNGKTASSDWSGSFTLSYGTSCDDTHALIGNQTGGCSVTRTAPDGDTRTITGPDGNTYAVTHDTNGAGTGWDSSVSPAPSNGGVVLSCDATSCADGENLVINGSHLTGTLDGSLWWNHTITTGAEGLTVTGSGTSRTVAGTVTVQHNILKYTSTTTFDGVVYGNNACCFPTAGSVTTTFAGGPLVGETETLSFSSVCGESTLTSGSNAPVAVTLLHCI